jgi:hypothetical protein
MIGSKATGNADDAEAGDGACLRRRGEGDRTWEKPRALILARLRVALSPARDERTEQRGATRDGGGG